MHTHRSLKEQMPHIVATVMPSTTEAPMIKLVSTGFTSIRLSAGQFRDNVY
jgi:hypothetical protein